MTEEQAPKKKRGPYKRHPKAPELQLPVTVTLRMKGDKKAKAFKCLAHWSEGPWQVFVLPGEASYSFKKSYVSTTDISVLDVEKPEELRVPAPPIPFPQPQPFQQQMQHHMEQAKVAEPREYVARRPEPQVRNLGPGGAPVTQMVDDDGNVTVLPVGFMGSGPG